MVTQQEKLANKVKWVALAAALLMFAAVLVLALIIPNGTSSATTTGAVGTLIPNPFDAEDFTYRNGYMTCLEGQSWRGVDVSYHQGNIRWQEVADSGVQFAMIRLGNRTVREGIIRLDKCWEENYAGAKAAGLKVGLYFYSQAISVEEARQEAQFVLDVLDGRTVDMPVVFDWEVYDEDGRNASMDRQTLADCAVAFCEMIREAGYEPMVYFNLDLANRMWDLEQMQSRGYGFWLALYRDQMNWENRVDMWQYTESGVVPGIDEKVDINLYFYYE